MVFQEVHMNETISILTQRRSIRSYSEQEITAEEKQQIIQATLQAPTAGNMMLYTIIEVTDQAIKDQLAVTCDHQPFIAKAPWILLFLADYQRWYDYYRFSGVEKLWKE
jgi:nitroreductase